MSEIDTATCKHSAEMPPPRFRGRANSLDGLTKLGRVQLSRHFFFRDFLYSEIGTWHGLRNTPSDPNLAVSNGRALAEQLLEPLVETFGPIAIRSAYRSPEVNCFGAAHGLGCSDNEKNRARHIWELPDAVGRVGATASIVVPWFARRYEAGRDWRDLAWWLHDHLPVHAVEFFPKRAAFNLTWREERAPEIYSYIQPKGWLLAPGTSPEEAAEARALRYSDFPPFRGIVYPE